MGWNSGSGWQGVVFLPGVTTANRLVRQAATGLTNSLLSDDGTNVTLASGVLVVPDVGSDAAIAFGGTTAAFGALRRGGLLALASGIEVVTADVSAYAEIGAESLRLPSAGTISWNADTILARAAAANLRMGAAAANPPVAQTLSVQNASGTDIAGANFTLDLSQGTGTGAGGALVVRSAAAGLTGSSLNALSTLLTVGPTNVTLASGSLLLPATGVIDFGAGDLTLTASAGVLTFNGGTFTIAAGQGFNVTTTSITGTDNSPDLFAATARGKSAYLGTSLLVNTTAATALHADVTDVTGGVVIGAVANTNTPAALIDNRASAESVSLEFLKTRSGTGSDADTAAATGDGIMRLRSWAADGGAYRAVAQIFAEVDTYTGSDNVSGRLGFWTRNDGASAALTERWRVAKDGMLLAVADNTYDIGAATATRPKSIHVAAPALTSGSGAGLTVNIASELRRVVHKVTVTYAALAAAATTADKTIATLPAKTRLVGVLADTTTPYTGGGVTAATLIVGKSVGGNEYIVSHDVFSAAILVGDADADLGTSINRASAIQGGDLASWTGTTAISVRLTTTTANTDQLTAGSTTYYLTTESMP